MYLYYGGEICVLKWCAYKTPSACKSGYIYKCMCSTDKISTVQSMYTYMMKDTEISVSYYRIAGFFPEVLIFPNESLAREILF